MRVQVPLGAPRLRKQIMRIDELTVTPQANKNWTYQAPSVILPHDIEFSSPHGQKALHKAGTKVSYEVLRTVGQGFKVRLFRTVFSVVLSYDSKQEFIDDGFEI